MGQGADGQVNDLSRVGIVGLTDKRGRREEKWRREEDLLILHDHVLRVVGKVMLTIGLSLPI